MTCGKWILKVIFRSIQDVAIPSAMLDVGPAPECSRWRSCDCSHGGANARIDAGGVGGDAGAQIVTGAPKEGVPGTCAACGMEPVGEGVTPRRVGLHLNERGAAEMLRNSGRAVHTDSIWPRSNYPSCAKSCLSRASHR